MHTTYFETYNLLTRIKTYIKITILHLGHVPIARLLLLCIHGIISIQIIFRLLAKFSACAYACQYTLQLMHAITIQYQYSTNLVIAQSPLMFSINSLFEQLYFAQPPYVLSHPHNLNNHNVLSICFGLAYSTVTLSGYRRGIASYRTQCRIFRYQIQPALHSTLRCMIPYTLATCSIACINRYCPVQCTVLYDPVSILVCI